jgi:hypothetical protein
MLIYSTLQLKQTPKPKNGNGHRLPQAFGRTLHESGCGNRVVPVPQRGTSRQPRATPEEEMKKHQSPVGARYVVALLRASEKRGRHNGQCHRCRRRGSCH